MHLKIYVALVRSQANFISLNCIDLPYYCIAHFHITTTTITIAINKTTKTIIINIVMTITVIGLVTINFILIVDF